MTFLHKYGFQQHFTFINLTLNMQSFTCFTLHHPYTITNIETLFFDMFLFLLLYFLLTPACYNIKPLVLNTRCVCVCVYCLLNSSEFGLNVSRYVNMYISWFPCSESIHWQAYQGTVIQNHSCKTITYVHLKYWTKSKVNPT